MCRAKLEQTRTPAAKKKGRRAKSYSQAERLARMMRALASRGMTIREMAEEFAIERRQVYRDLARIEEEGHPLVQSQDFGEGTWQLTLNYKGLPPITLSPYELMSLYLAKSHLAFLKGTPFWEDLESVIAKVEAGLPVRTTNHLELVCRFDYAVPGEQRADDRTWKRSYALDFTWQSNMMQVVPGSFREKPLDETDH